MTPLSSLVSTELLPRVIAPGQYIGGEINQLPSRGDWRRAKVRVALAFPDTYAVGMSHLGSQILYWLINHTPDCCAERVYCPWIDAEKVMRERSIELFTWDTRQPVSSADILAVSLQYEMTFTSVLLLMDLSGIPLRADQRNDDHPLVICGGPQADNPEPIAPFVDLVVIGDGEASMAAILETYKELKDAGARRREMIPEMARRFPWAYAPSLFDVTYNQNGTILAATPKDSAFRGTIQRCGTNDLDQAPFPSRPLVPYVETVHDRFAVEIMRGCPQRCRFCHAGYTKRPLRMRSVDRILELADEMYASTGMDEFGLLSLSTADYPHIRELAERANRRFAPHHVNISLPSLRVDKMLSEIPWMASSVRKSGLTIAAEVANDELRAAIRKKVTDGNLLDGVRQAYEAGWRSVKLYFICGFPGEKPSDIEGIVQLCRRVSDARRELGKGPAAVKASVAWLVPKPFTPLQWAAQPTAEYFHDVNAQLRSLLRRKKGGIKIRTHNIERSVLEAVFSRGDRRLADVIEHAYRNGARFDGWDECFNPTRWSRAFEAVGIDPAFYANRQRDADEIFPWSHIVGGPSRDYLRRQYDDFLTRIGAVDNDAAAR